MGSGSRAAVPVGAAAVLAALVLVAVWMLAGDDGGTPDRAALEGETAPGEAAGALPGAERTGGVTPLPLEDAPDGAESDDVSVADAPPTLATVGVAVSLHGRVVDASGLPVTGALLRHAPSPGAIAATKQSFWWFSRPLPFDELPSATTDARGRFEIEVRELPADPGGSTLRDPADVPGLLVLHPAYETKRHLCTAFARGEFDVGDIVLRPGGILSGRVVDPDGQPIEGAVIDHGGGMGAPDPERRAEFGLIRMLPYAPTGPDGRFELTGLWAGDQDLRIAAAGYVPRFPEITMAPGERRHVGNVALLSGRTIAGAVRDVAGEPLAGTKLKARPPEGLMFLTNAPDGDFLSMQFVVFGKANLEIRASSDEDGSFRFTTLDRDRYDVFAGLDGYEVAAAKGVETGTQDLLLTLQEQAAAIVTVVDASTEALVPGVTGSGHRYAVAEDDKSRRGALTVLSGQPAVEAAGGGLPADGLLVARGIGSQRNTLVVSAPGYATRGFFLPTAEAPERVRKTVKLVRASGITGRVLDGHGEPVPGARVTLATPEAMRVPVDVEAAVADVDGRYRFTGLSHGDWSITAAAPGYVESEPRVVPVARERLVEEVDVVLAAGGRIVGVVLRADGRPAETVQVSATPAGKSSDWDSPDWNALQKMKATTDADGRFAILGLEPGDYTVAATTAEPVPVPLTAGGETEVTLMQRTRPRLRGSVLDAGRPVPGAIVLLQAEFREGTYFDERETATDASGGYELELPEAGTYRLSATEGGVRSESVPVEGAWGQVQLVDLRFGSGRAVGRVRRADTDAPLQAGVRFVLLRAGEGGSSRERDAAHQQHLEVGADGQFAAERLLPGRYTVTAGLDGFVDATVEVDVVAGESREVPELRLASAGALAGVVHTPGGDPPPAGLRMQLLPGAADQMGRNWGLEADGRFTVTRLAPGPYRIEVVRRRQAAAGAPWESETLDGRDVVVTAGETTRADLLVNP